MIANRFEPCHLVMLVKQKLPTCKSNVSLKLKCQELTSHFYKDILIDQKGLDYNHDVDAIRRSHKDFLQNKSFLCFIYNPFVAPVDYSLFMRKKTIKTEESETGFWHKSVCRSLKGAPEGISSQQHCVVLSFLARIGEIPFAQTKS